jgi:hypothetical protein
MLQGDSLERDNSVQLRTVSNSTTTLDSRVGTGYSYRFLLKRNYYTVLRGTSTSRSTTVVLLSTFTVLY